MTDRRNFLKLFGIGATVAPVIAGMPSMNDQAIIVEPPKLTIPETPKIVPVTAMPDFGLSDCVVFLRDKKTQRTIRIDATGFVADYKMPSLDLTSYGDIYRRLTPDIGRQEITFTVTGPMSLSS